MEAICTVQPARLLIWSWLLSSAAFAFLPCLPYTPPPVAPAPRRISVDWPRLGDTAQGRNLTKVESAFLPHSTFYERRAAAYPPSRTGAKLQLNGVSSDAFYALCAIASSAILLLIVLVYICNGSEQFLALGLL
jgi:hypothetical protein